MNRRIAGSLWCLLFLLLCVSGCGLTAAQRDATAKFADAATKFGDASSTELQKMRDQNVAMNVALFRVPDLAIKDPVAVVDIECRTQQHCIKNLAGDFSGDWYTTFLSGPLAIKAYGAALTNILNADNEDQVKKSSDELAAALKAIPGSPLGNVSSDAISALSQQLTEMVLDNMKAHAIRSVVESVRTQVPTVCGKVSEQFALTRPNGEPVTDSFAFRFEDTAFVLASTSKQAITSNPRDPRIRSDGLSGYLLAQQNLSEAATAFPVIEKSGDACVTANSALSNALQNTTYELKDLENFYSAAQQLDANINALRKQ
jgi:hypothetical protein